MKSKFLLVGEWRYYIYERACADALKKLNINVIPFSWSEYFSSFTGKLEYHFNLPLLNTFRLNRELSAAVEKIKPEIVLIWRGTSILPSTLKKIRKDNKVLLVSYNNDDPFSPLYRKTKSMHLRRLWNNFNKSIPLYDLHFVFRPINIKEFRDRGAKEVEILKPYFISEIHQPVELTEEEKRRFETDVVFIGHYEGNRWELIRPLIDSGIKVKIFGSPKSWTKERLGSYYERLSPIYTVEGLDYSRAISGAKICLSFFSRLNRDIYAYRVFEITAAKGLLISERTPEMLDIFKENEEALYFSDSQELLKKVKFILDNPGKHREIAEAGFLRCYKDCHSVNDSMEYLLRIIEKISSDYASKLQ